MLQNHKKLRNGRKLAFEIETISFDPFNEIIDSKADANFRHAKDVQSLAYLILKYKNPIDASLFRRTVSIIQTISSIKPPKRRTNAVTSGSRDSIMKLIEQELVNLKKISAIMAEEVDHHINCRHVIHHILCCTPVLSKKGQVESIA